MVAGCMLVGCIVVDCIAVDCTAVDYTVVDCTVVAGWFVVVGFEPQRVCHIQGKRHHYRSSWNRNLHKTYSIPFILMLKI
jgi:hypothetical protein